MGSPKRYGKSTELEKIIKLMNRDLMHRWYAATRAHVLETLVINHRDEFDMLLEQEREGCERHRHPKEIK